MKQKLERILEQIQTNIEEIKNETSKNENIFEKTAELYFEWNNIESKEIEFKINKSGKLTIKHNEYAKETIDLLSWIQSVIQNQE